MTEVWVVYELRSGIVREQFATKKEAIAWMQSQPLNFYVGLGLRKVQADAAQYGGSHVRVG